VTRIKVSGITSAADAAAAIDAGADAIACVFNPNSPRYVTLEQAWTLRRAVPPQVLFVGIFADTPGPIVARIASHCGLDRTQLFGRETRDEVDSFRGGFKAVTVTAPDQADDAARTYLGRRAAPPPELLLHLSGDLVDAWDVAAHVTRLGNVMIASSAMRDANSAARAVQVSDPWGIDVWDAVEFEPGKLDPARLQDLVSAVRSSAAATQREPT
jgi:phosphoribosylanthranilate isomerase